jgi:ABC-type nitrate/sulfonate/bicarbonate transport system substrate-binding protein
MLTAPTIVRNLIAPLWLTDEYKRTPASRVVDGSAQFACTPSESVISYHTWPDQAKPKIVAVATLLQNSTSAIVTLKSSGIDRWDVVP